MALILQIGDPWGYTHSHCASQHMLLFQQGVHAVDSCFLALCPELDNSKVESSVHYRTIPSASTDNLSTLHFSPKSSFFEILFHFGFSIPELRTQNFSLQFRMWTYNNAKTPHSLQRKDEHYVIKFFSSPQWKTLNTVKGLCACWGALLNSYNGSAGENKRLFQNKLKINFFCVYNTNGCVGCVQWVGQHCSFMINVHYTHERL